jgi:hypothetical protein
MTALQPLLMEGDSGLQRPACTFMMVAARLLGWEGSCRRCNVGVC